MSNILLSLAAASFLDASLAVPARPPRPMDDLPPEPVIRKLDVMIVLDCTGSMGPHINAVRDGMEGFVKRIGEQKCDVAVGVTIFRDRFVDKDALRTLQFGGQEFTRDVADLKRQLAELRADGGGDEPESGLDALDHASQRRFRAGAERVLVFITDASAKVPDKDNRDENQVVEKLKERGIRHVHMVLGANPNTYENLQRLMARSVKTDDGRVLTIPAGKTLRVSEIAGRFDSILEGMVTEIVTEMRRAAGELPPLKGK